MASEYHIFVDVFDKALLTPGRKIKWLEIMYDGVVTEVRDDDVVVLSAEGEIIVPINSIELIGGMDKLMWVYHAESDSLFLSSELSHGQAITRGSFDTCLCNILKEYGGESEEEIRVQFSIVGGMDMGSNGRENFKPEVPVGPTLIMQDGEAVPVTKTEKKQPTADLVIAKYLETRDIIEAKTKALNAELADLKALQGRREQWLTAEMDRIGTDTLKMKAIGTSFFEKASSATVADGAAFMTWVGEDFETRKTYLENRVSKTAVKQGLDDNIPPPPGINYTTVRVLRVRRA